MKLIERLRAILGSDKLVLEEIRRESSWSSRRSSATSAAPRSSPRPTTSRIEDMIADEDMVITVTYSGYVKRSPLSLYRAQGRGGKGRTGMTTKDGDFVEHLFVASAHSYVLVFTQSGRVYWLKVHEIPQAGPAAKGKAIVNLLNLEGSDEDRHHHRGARVRRRPLPGLRDREGHDQEDRALRVRQPARRRHHRHQPRRGRPAARACSITDGTKELFLATADGMSIRFPETDCRPMGRATDGVRGISLRKGDRVVGMEALEKEGAILTAAERGIGKRTPIAEYREQGRGGLGVINLKVSAKTGKVVGVAPGDARRPGDPDHPGRHDHPHARSTASARSAARPRACG